MADQATLQQSTVLRRHESGQRTGPSADWATINPILSKGEIGQASDTGEVKVGDGVTGWNGLTGIADGGVL